MLSLMPMFTALHRNDVENVQVMHELQRADRPEERQNRAETAFWWTEGIVVRALESIGSTYEHAGQAASRPGQGFLGYEVVLPHLLADFGFSRPLRADRKERRG